MSEITAAKRSEKSHEVFVSGGSIFGHCLTSCVLWTAFTPYCMLSSPPAAHLTHVHGISHCGWVKRGRSEMLNSVLLTELSKLM